MPKTSAMWEKSDRTNKTFETAWVYGLYVESDDGDRHYRYVGLSTVDLEKRLATFKSPSARVHGNPNVATSEWVHANLSQVRIEMLEVMHDVTLEDRTAMMSLHIAELSKSGHDLLNSEIAGSSPHRTSAQIKKMRRDIRARRKRPSFDEQRTDNGHEPGRAVPLSQLVEAELEREQTDAPIVAPIAPVKPAAPAAAEVAFGGVPKSQTLVISLQPGVVTQRELDMAAQFHALRGRLHDAESALREVRDHLGAMSRAIDGATGDAG